MGKVRPKRKKSKIKQKNKRRVKIAKLRSKLPNVKTKREQEEIIKKLKAYNVPANER